MRDMPENSVDSIVTDPPYGLSFMGKKWDYDVPSVEIWAECLRILKPGGHLLAFAGTRTQHRMACRIEDAGFEIRDMIAWVYRSGFPKSLDVSKAIDKQAGAERERVSGPKSGGMAALNKGNAAHGYREAAYYDEGNMMLSNEPATEAAHQWQGWGTALKPALEPITVARKPLAGTVAANVLEHGTGGLNIDGCRVSPGEFVPGGGRSFGACDGVNDGWKRPSHADYEGKPAHNLGRWPANLIHDGSDEVTGLFPVTTSGKTGKPSVPNNPIKLQSSAMVNHIGHGDTGSAARFFYCAKASKADRDEGCGTLPQKDVYSEASATPMRDQRPQTTRGNSHPTVKPNALMRYLCRLVTPPGGTVLDPFAGSGSTGKAALQEGFSAILCELNPEYGKIIEGRTNVTPGLGI